MVSDNQVGFSPATFQGKKYSPITIWPALRFQRDEINSLRNGRDSENAFKDPEDGFGRKTAQWVW